MAEKVVMINLAILNESLRKKKKHVSYIGMSLENVQP